MDITDSKLQTTWKLTMQWTTLKWRSEAIFIGKHFELGMTLKGMTFKLRNDITKEDMTLSGMTLRSHTVSWFQGLLFVYMTCVFMTLKCHTEVIRMAFEFYVIPNDLVAKSEKSYRAYAVWHYLFMSFLSCFRAWLCVTMSYLPL